MTEPSYKAKTARRLDYETDGASEVESKLCKTVSRSGYNEALQVQSEEYSRPIKRSRPSTYAENNPFSVGYKFNRKTDVFTAAVHSNVHVKVPAAKSNSTCSAKSKLTVKRNPPGTKAKLLKNHTITQYLAKKSVEDCSTSKKKHGKGDSDNALRRDSLGKSLMKASCHNNELTDSPMQVIGSSRDVSPRASKSTTMQNSEPGTPESQHPISPSLIVTTQAENRHRKKHGSIKTKLESPCSPSFIHSPSVSRKRKRNSRFIENLKPSSVKKLETIEELVGNGKNMTQKQESVSATKSGVMRLEFVKTKSPSQIQFSPKITKKNCSGGENSIASCIDRRLSRDNNVYTPPRKSSVCCEMSPAIDTVMQPRELKARTPMTIGECSPTVETKSRPRFTKFSVTTPPRLARGLHDFSSFVDSTMRPRTIINTVQPSPIFHAAIPDCCSPELFTADSPRTSSCKVSPFISRHKRKVPVEVSPVVDSKMQPRSSIRKDVSPVINRQKEPRQIFSMDVSPIVDTKMQPRSSIFGDVSPVISRYIEPRRKIPMNLSPVVDIKMQPRSSIRKDVSPVINRRMEPRQMFPTDVSPVVDTKMQPRSKPVEPDFLFFSKTSNSDNGSFHRLNLTCDENLTCFSSILEDDSALRTLHQKKTPVSDTPAFMLSDRQDDISFSVIPATICPPKSVVKKLFDENFEPNVTSKFSQDNVPATIVPVHLSDIKSMMKSALKSTSRYFASPTGSPLLQYDAKLSQNHDTPPSPPVITPRKCRLDEFSYDQKPVGDDSIIMSHLGGRNTVEDDLPSPPIVTPQKNHRPELRSGPNLVDDDPPSPPVVTPQKNHRPELRSGPNLVDDDPSSPPVVTPQKNHRPKNCFGPKLAEEDYQLPPVVSPREGHRSKLCFGIKLVENEPESPPVVTPQKSQRSDFRSCPKLDEDPSPSPPIVTPQKILPVPRTCQEPFDHPPSPPVVTPPKSRLIHFSFVKIPPDDDQLSPPVVTPKKSRPAEFGSGPKTLEYNSPHSAHLGGRLNFCLSADSMMLDTNYLLKLTDSKRKERMKNAGTQAIDEFDTETLHIACTGTKGEGWSSEGKISEILSSQRSKHSQEPPRTVIEQIAIATKRKLVAKTSMVAQLQDARRGFASERRTRLYEKQNGALCGSLDCYVIETWGKIPLKVRVLTDKGPAILVISKGLLKSSKSVYPGAWITIYPPWDMVESVGGEPPIISCIRCCDIRHGPVKKDVYKLEEVSVDEYLQDPKLIMKQFLGIEN